MCTFRTCMHNALRQRRRKATYSTCAERQCYLTCSRQASTLCLLLRHATLLPKSKQSAIAEHSFTCSYSACVLLFPDALLHLSLLLAFLPKVSTHFEVRVSQGTAAAAPWPGGHCLCCHAQPLQSQVLRPQLFAQDHHGAC